MLLLWYWSAFCCIYLPGQAVDHTGQARHVPRRPHHVLAARVVVVQVQQLAAGCGVLLGVQLLVPLLGSACRHGPDGIRHGVQNDLPRAS